jgi:predicted ATPase/class 3 adenylate cyclase
MTEAPGRGGIDHPLPSGTATFLFTDIQGSTEMVQRLDLSFWEEILETHHRLLREQWTSHDGHEVKTEGDAFFVAFHLATDAVAACVAAQKSLAAHPWPEDAQVRVRMGLHTGQARLVGESDYVGLDVHRAARIVSTAHGGQVVMSDATRILVDGHLPDGITLVDLGEHRLKDLTRPEHLYQLKVDGLNPEFPALKSLNYVPNNLPTMLTSFVGRDNELARGRELLGGSRLLTLTGPGGTGKTRLSMQLAADVSASFKHGVFFVSLAAISDPELVPSTIAKVVGLQNVGKRPPLEALIDYLKEKQMLIVLDNFEQILPAAAAVSDVLSETLEVKIIVTSRAALRVYGEQELPVPTLALPDPAALPPLEVLSQYEAVRLFMERAMTVKPDFQVTKENALAVARITTLVDGLPLAIELAAARIRIFTPQVMATRFQTSLAELTGGARDLPARQQTLRGAIAWSYDLLDDDVRTLMTRLAVFVPSGFLEDIESICGDLGGRPIDVLSGIETLVEQNLVRPLDEGDQPRFLMLHVIREFALGQLAAGEEDDEIRNRHADSFLRHAEEAAPHVLEADSKKWLDLLDIEHDNIRAALDYWLVTRKSEEAMRLVGATWRFWQLRGHLLEGRERLDSVLALPGTDDYPKARMLTLEAAGGIAWWQGDIAACKSYYEQALALARKVGSKAELANAIYNLGFPLGESIENAERALELTREALAIFEDLGDRVGVARARFSMSKDLASVERFDEAWDSAHQAAATFRELGLRFGLIWALHAEGRWATRLDLFDRAREPLAEGLRLQAESGDVAGISVFLGDYADLAIALGESERALRLRGASSAIQAQTGASVEEFLSTAFVGRYRIDQNVSDERTRALLEEGRAMTPDEAVGYALATGETGVLS